ncbi:MAG TPA: S9 family peptidase, partial [Anaerolineaceae bacterium]|nr:S9 family peptidase [Anaerolineaceae bacterium]
ICPNLADVGPARSVGSHGGLGLFSLLLDQPKQIAFLSDAGGSSQQQLYTADVSTGIVRRLTNLTGFLSSPAWSPDGHSLAFLFIENAPRAAGPLQPMTPPSGEIEKHIYEQRLNVVDAAGGSPRAVSPSDMYVYEYDWAPDGKSFATIAAQGDGDNNWWIAQLYSLGLDGRMTSLYKPKFQIANPRFSPDGRTIAFIEGLMSDQGATGGDVYTIASTGSAVRNLTPGMPASATWLEWSGPQNIQFTQVVDGNSGVATVDTNGQLTQIWNGPELITAGSWDISLSLARDGRQSAVIRSSAQRPPEVWAGAIGGWAQMTRENGDVHPLWGEQRSLHWKSDNLRVQGWLLFPRDYDASKRYPLIVNVHGGPASACTATWPGQLDAPLAAMGYFVLCPNPRGSFGRGAAFTQGNVKDFGGGDLRDIMAGVDQVLREVPVDANRLGIQGWSYGGYMTMWAETQTNRFRAAFAGAGIANWLSYYGQNDIDQWLIPYFGASVYDDPAVYNRSQPISFVKNVKTPTLIVVGDRDGECPAPQSFEWWHALKTFKIPVKFVVYPDEGHMIQQPQHRRDITLRSVEWFDQWLKAGAQPHAAAAR